MVLKHARGELALERTAVMGILNVTPDSFSDGGAWFDAEAALRHALDMAAAGADVIDVGGESTRPGADPVDEDEELRRVIPVIERLRAELDVPISIDTRKSSVARAALGAGASIVNDTLGEAAADTDLYEVAAAAGAGLVIMHSRGTPADMRELTDYDDVVEEVAVFLAARAAIATQTGVARDAIAVDPGIGFAKKPAQSMALLGGVARIKALGYPVLVGASRKSFIGSVLSLPEDQRLEGTLAATVIAVLGGATIVRVHDVEPVRRAVRVAEAILAASR